MGRYQWSGRVLYLAFAASRFRLDHHGRLLYWRPDYSCLLQPNDDEVCNVIRQTQEGSRPVTSCSCQPRCISSSPGAAPSGCNVGTVLYSTCLGGHDFVLRPSHVQCVHCTPVDRGDLGAKGWRPFTASTLVLCGFDPASIWSSIPVGHSQAHQARESLPCTHASLRVLSFPCIYPSILPSFHHSAALPSFHPSVSSTLTLAP